jgi:hypothetical protein
VVVEDVVPVLELEEEEELLLAEEPQPVKSVIPSKSDRAEIPQEMTGRFIENPLFVVDYEDPLLAL